MLTLTYTTTNAQDSQFKISQYALEVLSSNPSAEDLEMLFETEQFSSQLEEYLFERMDNCPSDKSYLELVQEELAKLDLLLLPTSVEAVV